MRPFVRRIVAVAVVVLAAVFAVRTAVLAANDVSVRVEGGLVAGASQDGVRAYKGIPFAAPPVGELRWRPPAPVRAWAGVRKADQYAAPCMQATLPGLPGTATTEFDEVMRLPGPPSEDCLYLNVWTAAKTAAERRPVMLWIHGGGMVIGSPAVLATDGAALAKKGVVLVSINYRLGVFGFLAHPALTKESSHHSSGNYGLLDQVAALQWVQQNIAAFGGDPGNVTIFGESAGSWSVNLLVASPLGKGLFRRAIGESGALLLGLRALGDAVAVNGQTLAEAEQAGLKMAQAAGAKSLGELRARSAAALLKAATPAGNPLGAAFGAAVDGWVLPDSVDKIFASGRQNHVPVLIGSNQNEGALFQFQPVRADAAREQARRGFGAQADAYLKLYPATTDDEARASSAAFTGDAMFGLQMRTWARLQKKGVVYLYWFYRAAPDAQCKCATHGAEIVYAFNNVALSKRPFQDVDRRVADTMSSYWVNFAKKGNPNGPGLPKWPAYTEQGDLLMALGDTIEPRAVPHKEGLDFLEGQFKTPLAVSR